MKRILFFFVDGVGLDSNGSSNPFTKTDLPAFQQLASGQRWCQPFTAHSGTNVVVRPISATLGVEGLPQSGTGQATLLTGVNCASRVGRHFGPFPHSTTHPILDQRNLFHQVKSFPQSIHPVSFANAFPPQYFNAVRRRSTVTTYCCKSAGVELRDLEALRTDRAVAADLTGTSWRKHLNLDVRKRSFTKAAQVLLSVSRNHALTLFEYFLTDKVGHERIDTAPQNILGELDQFFGALLSKLDPTQTTLLITSDHGNIEDTSHTLHTRNPVPLIVYGWAAPYFEGARDLTDITPGIIEALHSTLGDSPPVS